MRCSHRNAINGNLANWQRRGCYGWLCRSGKIFCGTYIVSVACRLLLTDLMTERWLPRLRCRPAHFTHSRMPYVGPPQLVSGCPQSMQALVLEVGRWRYYITRRSLDQFSDYEGDFFHLKKHPTLLASSPSDACLHVRAEHSNDYISRLIHTPLRTQTSHTG